MKRIISLLFIAFVFTASCLAFSGCDQAKIQIDSVTINTADISDVDENYAVGAYHQVAANCTIKEDFPELTARYIFSKNGESYYLECKQENVEKGMGCFSRYLVVPVYYTETVKNLNPSHKDLILTDGDILDTLGKGTKVTVEIYHNGEKLAEKSTVY